jgi:hypothetical protein
MMEPQMTKIRLAIYFAFSTTLLACSSSSSVDIYQALVNRVGMSADDPKLEKREVLANCSIEGRPATLGIVTFSYSMMHMAGLNRRGTFGPMYVAARKEANGDIVTVIGDANDQGQVQGVKAKWVDFWACKLGAVDTGKAQTAPIAAKPPETKDATPSPGAQATGETPASKTTDASDANRLADPPTAAINSASEQFDAGLKFYNAGDFVQANEWFQKAAAQGVVGAQRMLGLMYLNGSGVAKDYATAAAWYEKAAAQGDGAAQNNLGVMYERGYGVGKDEQTASAWYRKAADQGNASAQAALGFRYDTGLGVARDATQAATWYQKAAEQGNAVAQYNLGLLYLKGEGVAQDKDIAAQWIQKAAAQGNADAQRQLASIGGMKPN